VDFDSAEFAAGIAADQLWFKQEGMNLEVHVMGTFDRLTVSNWYSGAEYQLDQFQTSDGKVLVNNQVQLLVEAMANFAPPGSAQTSVSPTLQPRLGAQIATNWT
jgi:hypothetical protein